MRLISRPSLLVGLASTVFAATQEDSTRCASASTRIVGGQTIHDGDPGSPFDAAWIVSIGDAALSNHFCGGSWISNNQILTASHCFPDPNSEITFAVNKKLENGEWEQWTTFKVNQVTLHPDYNEATAANDIAIITLCDSAKTWNGPIIRLPELGETQDFTHYWVYGWGATFTDDPNFIFLLRWVETPAVDYATCDAQYGLEQMGFNSDMVVCAGTGETDACQGDSGGPLVQYNADCEAVQWGVVSFGKDCGDPNHAGVYANVVGYLPWIKSHINGGENFDYALYEFDNSNSDLCKLTEPDTPINAPDTPINGPDTPTESTTTTFPYTQTYGNPNYQLSLINSDDDTWRTLLTHGMCVRVRGPVSNKKNLIVANCRDNNKFKWVWKEGPAGAYGGGSISLKHFGDYCVEAPNGNSKAVFLNTCDENNDMQQWLYDPLSGMVHLVKDPSRVIWFKKHKKLRIFNFYQNMFFGNMQ